MLLVIGATGNIGLEIVRLCVDSGTPVRAASRSARGLTEKYGDKIQVAVFDFDDPSSWDQAVQNVDTLFFIAPQANPQISVGRFLEHLKKTTSINHLVYSSGRTTGDVDGSALNQVEKLVRTSTIPFTILRPGWFMQNFSGWIGATIPTDKAFYLSAGSSKTAFIDVRDIAAVAHKILMDRSHLGETLGLTCEEALDHFQVAKAISDLTGVRINYIPLTTPEYVAKLIELGWPEESARFFAYLYELVAAGGEEEISPDVRAVLGRTPFTFDQFLADHKEEFVRLVSN